MGIALGISVVVGGIGPLWLDTRSGWAAPASGTTTVSLARRAADSSVDDAEELDGLDAPVETAPPAAGVDAGLTSAGDSTVYGTSAAAVPPAFAQDGQPAPLAINARTPMRPIVRRERALLT
ncbi:MAG: hypothetical protein ACREQX_07455, partial [Candidatus Binataceae bacterium]